MTKKDYEAIAEAMQDTKGKDWETVRDRLCEVFKADNGMFSPDRFRAACEPGANVKARTRYTITA